jgi:hypothetical protein
MGTRRGDRPDRRSTTQGGVIIARSDERGTDAPTGGGEEPDLDETLEEIIVLEDDDDELVPSPDRSADDDWMSGEFDIT